MSVVLRHRHLNDSTDRLHEVWNLFITICNTCTEFREKSEIKISGSHKDEYEDYLLGCGIMQSCRKIPMLWKNLLPSSSGHKNKLCRKQVQGIQERKQRCKHANRRRWSLKGWGQTLEGKRGKTKCFEEENNGINLLQNLPCLPPCKLFYHSFIPYKIFSCVFFPQIFGSAILGVTARTGCSYSCFLSSFLLHMHPHFIIWLLS